MCSISEKTAEIFYPREVLIKIEQINFANTFVPTYVHWVPSSSDVIKLAVEIY